MAQQVWLREGISVGSTEKIGWLFILPHVTKIMGWVNIMKGSKSRADKTNTQMNYPTVCVPNELSHYVIDAQMRVDLI